jgi:predicted ferric reductase
LRSQDISALQNQFSIASARRLSDIRMQLWKVGGDTTKNVIEQLKKFV